MSLTPLSAVHMTAALAATVIGPLALWARKGATQRPRLHRAAGYAWVTLMLLAATSAVFIHDEHLSGLGGFSWIHLLIPVTYGMLLAAFAFLFEGNIAGHRKTMQHLYLGSCGVAGVFTLAPNRYLGQVVLGQWLGVV